MVSPAMFDVDRCVEIGVCAVATDSTKYPVSSLLNTRNGQEAFTPASSSPTAPAPEASQTFGQSGIPQDDDGPDFL